MPDYGYVKSQSAAPAANTAAVVTFANPGTNFRLRVRSVIVSYAGSGTLAGGNLTIADTVGVAWSIDIATAGVLNLTPLEIQCAAGQAVVITLAAGSANVFGKINALVTLE